MKGSRLLLFIVLCWVIIPAYQAEARYYDARVGRWMSPDPLKERYNSLSPFCYSADNPIALLDPDGKRILVAGSTFFQRTALAALQKLTNDRLVLRKGEILIVKLGGQNPDKTLQNGTNLVRTLNAKGEGAKTVIIDKSDYGNSAPAKSTDDAQVPGKGSDTDVHWNPNNKEGGVDANGNRDRPPEIGLAHELFHAQDQAAGTVDKAFSGYGDPDSKGALLLPNYEVKVRREENSVRREQGVAERAKPLKEE